jgi:hypothetical protein
VPAPAVVEGKPPAPPPNIEQHEEKPSETATREARRTRFFMIGGSWLCVREIRKNYIQQQEVRLKINTAPARSVDSFKNISAMLERTACLAIKKTASL